MSGLAGNWMGDCLRAGKPSRYIINHPSRLSLQICGWSQSAWSKGWLSPRTPFGHIWAL